MPAKRKEDKKPLICRCNCPYCDAEIIVQESPFCQVCKISFGRCAKCGAIIMKKTAVTCQSCGESLH